MKVFAMPPELDVIGLGACAVDYIGLADAFPCPDTKNELRKIHVDGGGPAATALVALARLGAGVSYLGKLGSSALAQSALKSLSDEGVDISHIIASDENAGPYFAFILADQTSKQRTIWYSAQEVSHVKPEEVPVDFLNSAKYLLFDDYEIDAAIYCAAWAKNKSVKVVLDAEDPANEKIGELINLADILILPEAFAFEFTGKSDAVTAARELKNTFGPEIVTITQGNKGSYSVFGGGEEHFQPIFEVETVDTTGCGDVFHGAFTFGLLKGWSIPIVAEFATAVSSLKSLKLGGRSGIPTYAEVFAFLKERGSARIKDTL